MAPDGNTPAPAAANPGPVAPKPTPAPGSQPGLTADLWQSLAEFRLLDRPAPQLVRWLVARGVPESIAAQALSAMELHPMYIAGRRHQQLLRKLESVVGNLQRLWESDPSYRTVERRESVSEDELVSRFVRGCRPLVLTGHARDWPALERWQPALLKERFGQYEVEIQDGRNSDPRFEENKLALRRRVNFASFVERVTGAGDSNDCYLTANNELLRRPEFGSLLDDVGSLPPATDRARLPGSAFFWMGPSGTNTPLHHDTVMLFHTQVLGSKHWRLISPLSTPRLYNYNSVFSQVDLDRPDLNRFPACRDLAVLDTVVGPGETIFLPLAWWHQVRSIGVGVSLSYTNLTVANQFNYDNPSIRDW